MTEEKKYVPVDGSKYIFQLDHRVKIRFNADGWVEEMYPRQPGEGAGLKMQGTPGTQRDDLYARRYYDLNTRVVLLDIHAGIPNDSSGSMGLIQFKDLEPGSPTYERVCTIIEIARQLGMAIKQLNE